VRREGLFTAALLALTLGGTMAAPALAAPADVTRLAVGEGSSATEVSPTKVDVMGLFAHPDDDAGFTTPCGVWQDLYDVTCGIIMETRGEGGSNSVGPEAGPDLGLRRENEDRTSHVRSGTVDIYNVDRVDFFYNTSAPLTAEVWDKEEGLRQTVRIVRETRPDVLLGLSPAPLGTAGSTGHGNHQYAMGRLPWEVAAAAADPTMYPEQLTGPDAVDVWQVKKIVTGGQNPGTGGVAGPNCTTGFAPTSPFTVVGVWSGYESPYVWAPGNVQGMPAGTAKTWAQVGREGGRAHPTQARVMEQGVFDPTCTRYAVAESIVPIQPNTSPAAGRDDAILFGASIPDPGGMPLGSVFAVDTEDAFAAPGTPFSVTVAARSGAGTLATGTIGLDVPAGWTVSADQASGPITDTATTTATFTVTPAAGATLGLQRVTATFDNGTVTAYNEARVQVVQQVEGRYQRWGNAVEYEQWAEEYTWHGGRSAAIAKIGAGESVTVPVVVTNRSTTTQSGAVTITVPPGFTADATSRTFTGLAAGADTTVRFVLTHTDVTAAATATPVPMPITTTFGTAGASSTEDLQITVVPTTVVPELPAAPALDAESDDAYGPQISMAGRWEGAACEPDGVDCGAGSFSRLGWYGDDLYAFVHVVDDRASAAATPERCFGHWLVDSVEVLLDPRGDSVDTSTTFKSGIFPFTDDPTGANGNGANGPCWSRDADAHQGFSTGPLAGTVEGGPNSPGQQVVVNAVVAADGTYQGGGWDVEVKIPLGNLPAAVGPTSAAPTGVQATNTVDPEYLGLNVTPYDSDTQDFIGQTRTAWSAIGGQQSEPYRWGHAYLDGYAPPAGRPTTPGEAIIPDTALRSVESPQSVFQSATRGVTLSGQQPTEAMDVADVTITGSAVTVTVDSAEAGTARVFLWDGDLTFIPVWTTSCPGDVYGFEACSPTDGQAPPWGENMGGRLVGSATQPIGTGTSTITLPLTAEGFAALAEDGSVLVSYESASEGVNAWHFPVVQVTTGPEFVDVVPGQDFYTEIRWLADSGMSNGTTVGDQVFYHPVSPMSRQAMAAFLYRYAGGGWLPEDPQAQTFDDVPAGSQFHVAIEWMVAEGIALGYDEDTFGPTQPVSRQAMAAFLHRLAGEPEVAASTPFGDVPAGSAFAPAIAWLAAADITEGYPDGTFGATQAITRQAMAAFLFRLDRFLFRADLVAEG